jgi:hypothetical protein
MESCFHCHRSELEKQVTSWCPCQELCCHTCAAECHSREDFYEEWERCWACDGEGVNGHDCGEDCCPCLEPEENMTCSTCDGKGGWKPAPLDSAPKDNKP